MSADVSAVTLALTHTHTHSRLRTLEPCHRLTLALPHSRSASLRAPLSGEPLAQARSARLLPFVRPAPTCDVTKGLRHRR